MPEFQINESLMDQYAPPADFLSEAADAAFECLIWSEGYNDVGDIDSSVTFRVYLRLADFLGFEGVWDAIQALELSAEEVGHNFVLSSAHHGTGFWDRGHGSKGDLLRKAADGMAVELYEHDGTLYAN